MFSIIVCSIRPEEAEALKRNISDTIGAGIPFEFIAYDNRGTGKGICQVYNECAERAEYDCLCFMHEDVEFTTHGWGNVIAEKLSEKDCGVIGFAGNVMKSAALTGWSPTRCEGDRYNYIQRDGEKDVLSVCNPGKERFSQVIALDGMCLFMTKKLWSTIRFDDELLKGFHCYDLDFTIAAASAGFRNYVCHSVLPEHFSMGSYDRTWFEETMKIHRKWADVLPLSVEPMDERRRRRLESKAGLAWLNVMREVDGYEAMSKELVWKYVLLHPFNGRAYRLLNTYLRRR